jgi:hypothetical protein
MDATRAVKKRTSNIGILIICCLPTRTTQAQVYTNQACQAVSGTEGSKAGLYPCRPIKKLIPLWRNWLARLTVNQEVGSSSLPGGDEFSFCLLL